MHAAAEKPIHPFFWLGLPILFILGQIGIELFVPDARMPALHSEGGIHEALQSIFLLFALLLALFTALRADVKIVRLVSAVAALCIFYVLGEEISWGQHLLNWDTPAYWAQFNDQNETNLHNTSSWLDQKPRLILFIGIVIGGLIIPALRRWKPQALPSVFAPLYPSDRLIPASLGVLVPYMVQDLAERAFNTGVFERVSEVQELYMYYFVFLYMWELARRNAPQKSI
jgi:hypothetical protein